MLTFDSCYHASVKAHFSVYIVLCLSTFIGLFLCQLLQSILALYFRNYEEKKESLVIFVHDCCRLVIDQIQFFSVQNCLVFISICRKNLVCNAKSHVLSL